MKIISLLVGIRFTQLIYERELANRMIKSGGNNLLKRSSKELEDQVSIEIFGYLTPNPLSLVVLCILFTIPFACGTSMFADYFTTTAKSGSLLYLKFILAYILYMVLMLHSLACGLTSGLLRIIYIYLLNISLTLAGLAVTFFNIVAISEWIAQLSIFSGQLLILYFCRCLMNSKSFHTLIVFIHSFHMLIAAKELRAQQHL